MSSHHSLEQIICCYRSPEEASKFAELLAANGVSGRKLLFVLTSFHELQEEFFLTDHNDIQIALLAGEVQAQLQFQSHRISVMRGRAFDRLSVSQSLASIGSEIGMTKQSVFKVIRETRQKE